MNESPAKHTRVAAHRAPAPEGRGWRVLPSAVVAGCFFALCMLVGQSFAEVGDFSQIIGGWGRVGISVAKFALYALVFGVVANVLFGYLDRRAARRARAEADGGARTPGASAARQVHLPTRSPAVAVLDKHLFGCVLALLLISWGVYLVIFAPGSLTYDGARSLNQFTTDMRLENHHPVLMNLLYGGIMNAARMVGPDNLGLFLIVVLQTLALAWAYAAIIKQARTLGLPLPVAVVAALYFALFPAWGVLAQDVIKDTLFCAVLALFALALTRVITASSQQPATVRQWVLLGVAAALVALTRNNGIYIVAPTLLALAVLLAVRGRQLRASRAPRPVWPRAAAVLAGVALVYVALTSFIYPAAGVDMREEKEMLSIPFQQTARCLLEHPDDVTPEERQAIDAVLPFDQLPQLYDPDLSDPVKETYKLHNSKVEGSFDYAEQHPDALKTYLVAWASMGLRHPLTYVEATVANTYAYFYPGEIIDCEGTRPVLLLGQIGEPINLTYDVSYLMPASVVDAASAAVQGTLENPVLAFLYSPAPYVWLFVLLVAYLVHARRWEGLVVCLPAAMLLLTVLAGPLNGHLRYLMPLVGLLPLMWSFAFAPRNHREQ